MVFSFHTKGNIDGECAADDICIQKLTHAEGGHPGKAGQDWGTGEFLENIHMDTCLLSASVLVAYTRFFAIPDELNNTRP